MSSVNNADSKVRRIKIRRPPPLGSGSQSVVNIPTAAQPSRANVTAVVSRTVDKSADASNRDVADSVERSDADSHRVVCKNIAVNAAIDIINERFRPVRGFYMPFGEAEATTERVPNKEKSLSTSPQQQQQQQHHHATPELDPHLHEEKESSESTSVPAADPPVENSGPQIFGQTVDIFLHGFLLQKLQAIENERNRKVADKTTTKSRDSKTRRKHSHERHNSSKSGSKELSELSVGSTLKQAPRLDDQPTGLQGACNLDKPLQVKDCAACKKPLDHDFDIVSTLSSEEKAGKRHRRHSQKSSKNKNSMPSSLSSESKDLCFVQAMDDRLHSQKDSEVSVEPLRRMPTVHDRLSWGHSNVRRDGSDPTATERQIRTTLPENVLPANESYLMVDHLFCDDSSSQDRNRRSSPPGSCNQPLCEFHPSHHNKRNSKSRDRSAEKRERSRSGHSLERERSLRQHRVKDQPSYSDTSNFQMPCSDKSCDDRHRSYTDRSHYESDHNAFRENRFLDNEISDDRLERSSHRMSSECELLASTKSRSNHDKNEDTDRRIQQRLLELSGCHDLGLETQRYSCNKDRHYSEKDNSSSDLVSPCSYKSVTNNATVWTADDERKREADKRPSLELEILRKARDMSKDKSSETSHRRDSMDKPKDRSRRKSKDSHDLDRAVELSTGKNSDILKKSHVVKRRREKSRDKLSGKTKKRSSHRHSHSSLSKKESGKSRSKISSKHKKTKRRRRHYSSDSLPDLDAMKPPGDPDEKLTGLAKTDAAEVPVSEPAILTTPAVDGTIAKTTSSSTVEKSDSSSADCKNSKRYFTPRKPPDKLSKDDDDDDDFIPMKLRKETHDNFVFKTIHNVTKNRDIDVAAKHLLRSIIHRKPVKHRLGHASAAPDTISRSCESIVNPATAVECSLPLSDASVSEVAQGDNSQTDVILGQVSEEFVKDASNILPASTNPSQSLLSHGSYEEVLDTKTDEPVVSPHTEDLHSKTVVNKIIDTSPGSSPQNDAAVMTIVPADGNPARMLQLQLVAELPARTQPTEDCTQRNKDEIAAVNKASIAEALAELDSHSNLLPNDGIHGLVENREKEISVDTEDLPNVPCSKQSDTASESTNNNQNGTEKKETDNMGSSVMGPPLMGLPLMGPPLMGPPLTMPVIFKKPLMVRRLGLRISDQSAAIISAGVQQEKEVLKEKSREEGEITDSEDDSDSDESDDDDDIDDEPVNNNNDTEHRLTALQSLNSYADLDSSGSITDSEEDGELPPDETADRTEDVEKLVGAVEVGAVAGTNTVKKHERKKSKKKHGESKSKKKTKKHKKRSKSKEKNSKSSRSKHKTKTKKGSSLTDKLRRRALSRSRSRSYSVMRTFDEARGVWRMKRPEKIQARLEAQRRLKACSNLRIQIDKERLREIAVMNAYKNMKLGRGPKVSLKATEIARLMAGGKTIEELTDFCKSMARSGRRSSGSESDEERDWHRKPPSDDESDEAMMLRNRKLLLNKETKMIMNIRNSRQIPVLSKEEKAVQAAILRQNFPVSSGVQHRDRESEWQPYVKPVAAPAPVATPASIEEKPKPEATCGVNVKSVGEIVTERLNALRQLSANPNDTAAMSAALTLQQQLQQWAASKQNPGTLPVGTRVRMPRSLFKSMPSHQLTTTVQYPIEVVSASPVTTNAVPPKGGAVLTDSCIGKLLLQKMGWKDGEGLGKDNTGPTAPLILDMKKDRKGLAWDDPSSRLPKHNIFRPQPLVLPPGMQDLSRLHPISALNEMCLRKRWRIPMYELIDNCGPDHCKSFRFKVTVDGVEYLPAVGSGNKKTARMEAALACLRELAAMVRLSDAVNFPNANAPSQPQPLLGLQLPRPPPPRLLPPRPLPVPPRPSLPRPLQPRALPPQQVFCPPQNISDQAPFTFDFLDSEANNLCGPPLKLNAEHPAGQETSDNVELENPPQTADHDKEIDENTVSDECRDSLPGDPKLASKSSLLGAPPAPGLLGAPPAPGLLGAPPMNQKFSVPPVRITSLMNLRCAPTNQALAPRGLLPTPTRHIMQPRAPVAGRINATAVPRPRLNFLPRLPQFVHRNVRPLLSDFGLQPRLEFIDNFDQFRCNFAQHPGGGELFREVSFTDDVFEDAPAFAAAAFDEDLRFNQSFHGFAQVSQEFARPPFQLAEASRDYSENPAELFNQREEELFPEEPYVENSDFDGPVFEQFAAGFARQVPSVFEQPIRPRDLFFPRFPRPPGCGMMPLFPEEHEWQNR